ncbi:MAG: hypothetical protein ABSB84_05120 [Verrucomicrobiota bacterium]|jgi:uncharacterized membrane protein
MKSLLYLLVLSPFWAAIATWLTLQIFSSTVAFIIYLIGLLRGIVNRKILLTGLKVVAFQIVIMLICLWGLAWLFESVLLVCETRGQKTVFWIVAIVITVTYLYEIIQKMRRNWEFAHIPGAFEEHVWSLKLLRTK